MQNYLNFAFLPTLILIYLILVYPSQDINKSQNVEGENVELQPQSAFTNINKYKYNHTSIVTLSIAFFWTVLSAWDFPLTSYGWKRYHIRKKSDHYYVSAI